MPTTLNQPVLPPLPTTPKPGVTTGTGTGGIPGDTTAYLNQVLPGFNNLSSGATGVIGNLLKGLPNPGTVQEANATFGVNSGLGTGSGFLQGRGADLYKQQGAANQQQGLTDLLQTLGTYSGTAVPTAGQSLQNSQFEQNYGLEQFQAILSALGLGNNIANSGQQTL